MSHSPSPISQIPFFTLDAQLLAPNGLNLAAFANRSKRGKEEAYRRLRDEIPDHVAFHQNPFTVDLARIQRAPAFSRLDRIWQLSASGKHGSKNRQTHTQDTMLVAQSLCQALQLGQESEYLAIAICAAHDIGHPPFAHQGERAIHNVLAKYGIAWDHDQAALQLLTDWPATEDQHQGLNPTVAVLEGVAKRYWKFTPTKPQPPYVQPMSRLPESFRDAKTLNAIHAYDFNGIEGQLAATSDWIAFMASDVADGLREGLLDIKTVDQYFPGAHGIYDKHLQNWKTVAQKNKTANLDNEALQDSLTGAVGQYVRNLLLADALQQTQKELTTLRKLDLLEHAEYVRDHGRPVVGFTPAMLKQVQNFQREVMEEKVFPKLMSHISMQTPDRMHPQQMVEEMLQDFICEKEFPLQPDWRIRRERLQAKVENAESPEQKHEAQKALVLCGVEYLLRMVGDRNVLNYHNGRVKRRQKSAMHANENAPAVETSEPSAVARYCTDRRVKGTALERVESQKNGTTPFLG